MAMRGRGGTLTLSFGTEGVKNPDALAIYNSNNAQNRSTNYTIQYKEYIYMYILRLQHILYYMVEKNEEVNAEQRGRNKVMTERPKKMTERQKKQ